MQQRGLQSLARPSKGQVENPVDLPGMINPPEAPRVKCLEDQEFREARKELTRINEPDEDHGGDSLPVCRKNALDPAHGSHEQGSGAETPDPCFRCFGASSGNEDM